MGRLDSPPRNSRLGWSDLGVSFGMAPSTEESFMKSPVLKNDLAAVLRYLVMFAVAFPLFSLMWVVLGAKLERRGGAARPAP